MNVTQKAILVLEEFKAFAFKGNMVDLAVGVIIGAAFGKIVDSLVRNIIMPLAGCLIPGEQDYLGWRFVLNGKAIPYGLFVGEVVNFLIVALALFFFIVKFLGWAMKIKIQQAAVTPAPTRGEQLLIEIRDLLQTQNKAVAREGREKN
jgi:large conductance mechanosensitive channel